MVGCDMLHVQMLKPKKNHWNVCDVIWVFVFSETKGYKQNNVSVFKMLKFGISKLLKPWFIEVWWVNCAVSHYKLFQLFLGRYHSCESQAKASFFGKRFLNKCQILQESSHHWFVIMTFYSPLNPVLQEKNTLAANIRQNISVYLGTLGFEPHIKNFKNAREKKRKLRDVGRDGYMPDRKQWSHCDLPLRQILNYYNWSWGLLKLCWLMLVLKLQDLVSKSDHVAHPVCAAPAFVNYLFYGERERASQKNYFPKKSVFKKARAF